MASPEFTIDNSTLYDMQRRMPTAPFAMEALRADRAHRVAANDAEREEAAIRTRRAISKARSQIRQLTASEHPDDIAAAAEIDARFYQQDWEAVATSLRMTCEHGRNVLEYLGALDSDAFLDFAGVNSERHAEVQAAFEEFLPVLQQQATERIGRVVDAGILPEQANVLLEQVLTGTRFEYRVLDSFEAGTFLCDGYCIPGLIAMANPFPRGEVGANITTQASTTFTHETGHALGYEGHAGFTTLLPNQPVPMLALLLEEPFVSHVTHAGLHGHPNVLHPDERKDRGAYEVNRRLLHTLTTMGSVAIPLDLMGEAHVESLKSRRLTARTELHRRLRMTFADYFPEYKGANILYVIANRIGRAPLTQQDKLIANWDDEIIARVTGITAG